jgi:hypothetical protein
MLKSQAANTIHSTNAIGFHLAVKQQAPYTIKVSKEKFACKSRTKTRGLLIICSDHFSESLLTASIFATKSQDLIC